MASPTLRRISALVDLLHEQPEPDVLFDVHVGEQGVRLEDGVDGPLVGRPERHFLARDPDASVGWVFEAGDHPERRGLAAARRAQQRKELTVSDL